MEERYYVQRLGVTEFLMRERQVERRNSIADVTIRRFTSPDVAHHYALVMNGQQRQLDALHGKWKVHAMTPEITGERE